MPVGLLPALALVVGAVSVLAGDVSDGAPFALGLPVLFVGAALAWWRQAFRLALGALLTGFLLAGAALTAEARTQALRTPARAVLDEAFGGFAMASAGPPGAHDPVSTHVRLTEDASVREGYVSLRGRVTAMQIEGRWREVDGGVIVSVNGAEGATQALAWRAGRTIEAPITFRRPARYFNEGLPDVERARALAGVTLLGSVKSGLLVAERAPASLPAELAGAARAYVRRAVAMWIAPHSSLSAGIATAVLIGDRTGLPEATREALQAAGTYHVIAISGGNIAILAAVATALLVLVGLRGRSGAATTIVLLLLYAGVVTAGPSVWRATLMAVLYFAARALDLRTGAWQTAPVAAAAMTVGRPLDIADPGFILTFGATIALLEGGRLGAARLPHHPALAWLAGSVAASLAVEVALLPVSAWLFSRVTIAGVVLNLVAVPLMGLVQIAALVVAGAAFVPQIAGPAGWLAHAAAVGLVQSANLVALAPWSSVRVPPPSLWLILAYYAALAGLLIAPGRVGRLTLAGALVVAALLVAGVVDGTRLSRWWSGTPPVLRLTVFDVGQGEALLLETPSAERILIDAGGVPYGAAGVDIGAQVLVPALWARGVRRLDAFLFTHGDPDHLGGGRAVIQALAPRHIWEGIRVPAHEGTRAFVEAASARGLAVETLRRGTRMQFGGVRVHVLHPSVPGWERRVVRNDDSVVLEVVYKQVALLLTGDIGADVERLVGPRLTPARTRILKVAHHGSRTSSSDALLGAWRPQIALISCGRGNPFGHPAPDVLDRLRAVGATVLRTDLHGQITMETDGDTVAVRTAIGPSFTLASRAATRLPSLRASPPPGGDPARPAPARPD